MRAATILGTGLVALVAAVLGLLAGGQGARLASAPPAMAGPSSSSFAEIVSRVNPAVVHITVIESARDVLGDPGADFPRGARRGEGSGFIVDSDGYILTNEHVVSSPDRIRVRLADKRELTATLVGADRSTDLALLRVQARGLPSVPLGDSDRLRVGEWVCAIGNPYRFDHSVTVGVVSSKGRKINDLSFDSYIQTDAAINPGNSGGPLINAAGEAIGINSAVSIQGQGIGFAVPINVAREVLQQLRTRGHVTRGYLGIQLQELDPDLSRLVGLTEPRGAMVLEVIPGEAADRAGLARYDVITGVSGARIENGDELVRTIAAHAPGSEVDLEVFRDGRRLDVRARLAERGTESVGRPALPPLDEGEETAAGDRLGLVVAALSPEMKGELSIPEGRAGVVVREVVGLESGADQLSHGDLIVEVNRHPTRDLASYGKVVRTLPDGQSAWLLVYRPRPAGTFLVKVDVEAGRGPVRE
jgi:serine protease Do